MAIFYSQIPHSACSGVISQDTRTCQKMKDVEYGDRSKQPVNCIYEDSKLRREEEEGEKLATYIVLKHVTLACLGPVGVVDHVALDRHKAPYSPYHNIIRYLLRRQSLSAIQVMLCGTTRYKGDYYL